MLAHMLFNDASIQRLGETRKWRLSNFRSRIPEMLLEFLGGKIEWQPAFTCSALRQPRSPTPVQNRLVHGFHTGAAFQANSLHIAHCIVRQDGDGI